MNPASFFRPALAAVLATILAGCAAPGSGTPVHDALQKGVDTIGGMLGGGPPSAGTAAPPTPATDGKMVVINGINILVDGTHPTDPRWQGKLIAATPLNHLFDAHPIRRPGDYWPRVAIRIDDYSETLVGPPDFRFTTQLPNSTTRNVARPTECLKFTAMVWLSEKQSQRVDNVVLCNTDIQSTDPVLSSGALRNYRNTMGPVSISSEQLRTFGPRVPTQLLPQADRTDVQLYSNGQALFSSLFAQLGFRGPLDGDQRLWFVNLATPATK